MKTSKIMLVTLMVLAILASAFAFLSACKEDEPADEYAIKDCYISSGMPENTGTIEWLNAEGATTKFNSSKPVVILFEGITDASSSYGYILPTDVYYYGEGGALSDRSAGMHTNTAYYWYNLGFNVGLFHAECFTSDTILNVIKKTFSSSAMTFTNKDGKSDFSNDTDYSLVDLFCSAWEKTVAATPMTGTSEYGAVQEVRFVANGASATLATAIAERLFATYQGGHLASNAVPNRITFTNPAFNNSVIDVKYGDKTIPTALSYCSETIKNLAESGVVFEWVTTDASALTSENYNEYESLKAIASNSAILKLRETYSSSFSSQYSKFDRAALDWYLYSAGGSDGKEVASDSVTNRGKNDTRPVLDKIDGVDGSALSLNTCRYALSAWTPTVFMRAMRGVTYDMKHLQNPMTGTYQDYTLEKFSSECYQYSDYSGRYIAGYLFIDSNSSEAINYAYSNRLAGFNVTLTITDTQSSTKIEAKTEADGFYRICAAREDFDSQFTLSILTPSSSYAMYTTKASTNSYATLSQNHVGIEPASLYFTAPAIVGQTVICNCAMCKA